MARKSKKVMLKDEQKFVNLSDGESALLHVLRRKESASLPVSEICKKAGIDESTYYRAFKKPDFNKVVAQECMGLVQASLLPTLHTVVAQAIEGKSHHWARILLEMGGVYTPNKESKAPTEIKFVVNLGIERPKFEDAIEVKGEVINDV